MNTLYKFGASWCSPCKAMDHLLDEVDQVKVVRIDIEQEPDKAMQFGVRAVPTLVIVNEEGTPVAFRSGGISRSQLQEMIRSAQS